MRTAGVKKIEFFSNTLLFLSLRASHSKKLLLLSSPLSYSGRHIRLVRAVPGCSLGVQFRTLLVAQRDPEQGIPRLDVCSAAIKISLPV